MKSIETELFHVELNMEYCDYTKNLEGYEEFNKRATDMNTGIDWLRQKLDRVQEEPDIEDAEIVPNKPE